MRTLQLSTFWFYLKAESLSSDEKWYLLIISRDRFAYMRDKQISANWFLKSTFFFTLIRKNLMHHMRCLRTGLTVGINKSRHTKYHPKWHYDQHQISISISNGILEFFASFLFVCSIHIFSFIRNLPLLSLASHANVLHHTRWCDLFHFQCLKDEWIG